MRFIPISVFRFAGLVVVAGTLVGQTPGDKSQSANDSLPKSPTVAQREAVEAAMQAGLKAQTDSLQKQRDALAKQMATPGMGDSNFIVPMLLPPASVDCPALTAAEVEPLINDAAQRLSVEAKLIRAVMKQESGFKPCALSYKGAQGLMQLMPQTAYELNVADPWDPKQNIDGGATLLKKLLDKYKGDLKLTLAAYNAGSNMVDDAGGIPGPQETKDYVASIMSVLGNPTTNDSAATADAASAAPTTTPAKPSAPQP